MRKDIRFSTSDKRGRVPTSSDPYIPEEGIKEVSVCAGCHAIYKNKRWYLDPTALEKLRKEGPLYEVTCPACKKIEDHYPEGIVTLRGEYLWNHEEEIRNILKNEEQKAMAKNPMERIMRIEREGDELLIETTEEKLAEHLGRALHKAHQGELNVSWADDHSVCRVWWQRPE